VGKRKEKRGEKRGKEVGSTWGQWGNAIEGTSSW